MPEILKTILLVSLGASGGACLRYAISKGLSHTPQQFPTFIINSAGSFLMGIAVVLIYKKLPEPWSATLALLFIAGFLGSFTTYSTFSKDLYLTLDRGFFPFLFFSLSQVLLGLGLFAAGYKGTQFFFHL